jgi:hypothetical protein
MHRSTTILLTSLLAAATLQPTAAVAVAAGDIAYGNEGRDTCVAESTHRCEVRR